MACKFELTFLGVSAAVPTAERFPSSSWITYNNSHFLVDCGEAAQIQMFRYGLKPAALDHIFISHLHGDHFYGLSGVLSTMIVIGRRKPLHIWHPGGLESLIMPLIVDAKFTKEQLPFELHWHAFDANIPATLVINKRLEIDAIPMKHSIPAAGFVFRELLGLRKMSSEAIEIYNIPFYAIDKIKRGADFTDEQGLVVPNHKLTFDPPKPRRLAFVTDTGWFESLPNLVGPCDLLVHEATFLSNIDKKEKLRYHCTAAQAATTALQSNSKKLLLNHISTRYEPPSRLVKEAKTIFDNTELGIQGERLMISSSH